MYLLHADNVHCDLLVPKYNQNKSTVYDPEKVRQKGTDHQNDPVDLEEETYEVHLFKI